MQKSIVEEQRHLYLVGCLLSFYQQMKVFETKADELREFHIEKPLLVFVGNRVTAPVMSGTPASQLRQWWLMERPQREEKNVYTLDNPKW